LLCQILMYALLFLTNLTPPSPNDAFFEQIARTFLSPTYSQYVLFVNPLDWPMQSRISYHLAFQYDGYLYLRQLILLVVSLFVTTHSINLDGVDLHYILK